MVTVYCLPVNPLPTNILLSTVSCQPCLVSLSNVSCQLLPVNCLLYPVHCLTVNCQRFPVNCILPTVSCQLLSTISLSAAPRFGPATTAHLLAGAVRRSSRSSCGRGLLQGLAVYVATDGAVYKGDVHVREASLEIRLLSCSYWLWRGKGNVGNYNV